MTLVELPRSELGRWIQGEEEGLCLLWEVKTKADEERRANKEEGADDREVMRVSRT